MSEEKNISATTIYLISLNGTIALQSCCISYTVTGNMSQNVLQYSVILLNVRPLLYVEFPSHNSNNR